MQINPILRALALAAAPPVVDFTIHLYNSGAGPEAQRSLSHARSIRDTLADVAARFDRASDAIRFCEEQAEFYNVPRAGECAAGTAARASLRYGCLEVARRIRAAFGLPDGGVSAPEAVGEGVVFAHLAPESAEDYDRAIVVDP